MPAHAGVAQLVERFSCKEDVAGSTPVTGSTRPGRTHPSAAGPDPGSAQRKRRAAKRGSVEAIASWAATSWISRVPAASVASRTA